MSNSTKNAILGIATIAVIAITVVALLKPGSNTEQGAAAMKDNQTNSPNEPGAKVSSPAGSVNDKTISSEWQWQALNKNAGSTNGDTVQLPFTPQSVHDALQAVKVDESGNVILDHDALIALEEALERIYNKLDGESMARLRELIEDALPGSVGEQTAKLVEDYQSFLQAKDEFSQVYEGTPAPYAEQSVATIEADQALYAELQALRQVHLGDDVATKLFSVSNANAQFMFDSMKLEMNTSLTPEQKAQRRQALQDRLEAVTGPLASE